MIGEVFWLGVWLAFAVSRGAVKFVFLLSSVSMYAHEALHIAFATLFRVPYAVEGFSEEEEAYFVQYESPSPRALLFINLSPILLASLSFSLFYFAFYSDSPFHLLLVLPALGLGMQSIPSLQDARSVFWMTSGTQPVSSVLSSLLALPFYLLQFPALYLDDYPYVLQFAVAVSIGIVASPFGPTIASLGVSSSLSQVGFPF